MQSKYLLKYSMVRDRNLKTNYEIKLWFGKKGKVESEAFGAGFCNSLSEVKKMHQSVISKASQVLKSELYFEGQLIVKK